MAGLPLPGFAPPTAAPGFAAPTLASTPRIINIGGVLPIGNQAAALAMDSASQRKARDARVEAQQASPVITNIAALVRQAWTDAKEARQTVEQEMIEALLARRGEYTAEKKALIKENRQPEIYMMVGAAKMRQVEALLRDVIIGTGAEKPWTARPTPVPEPPPEVAQQLFQQLVMEIQQAMMSGFPPSVEAARLRLRQLRDELAPIIMEEAAKRVERMEQKMEDQLLEGGYLTALDEFITDLATFKTAFVAGPVVRKKPKLEWGPGGQLTVTEALKLEWERVDPFDIYPARYAKDINDGPLLRRHRLSRAALTEMIGVEGFDEDAIRKVLERFGDSGLREWLSIDSQKADAEGKEPQTTAESGMIDALQYWGSVSGKMLREWGMDEGKVPDEAKEYQAEVWVIGPYTIKAALNADPLQRRPLYYASFQRVPGSVWGNSPYDLMKDCQDMCNAAARSLAANLGISSGPQVGVRSDLIPSGEELTEMFPWKIWQFTGDPMGASGQPITFFQPQSNANELMQVYERFSLLADEYTGVPRYMAGFNGGEGGAGRTASGISMMIGNASKVIKQVVGAIDAGIIQPMLDRLYFYNMQYGDDPELKGDLMIVARGASSLVARDAAQVRTNEFLQIALSSPAVQQIVGIEGIAELLRPAVKRLDMNPDKVVPPLPVIRQRAAEAAMLAMQQAAMQGQQEESKGGPSKSGQQLEGGAPVADNFSPPRR